MYLDELSLILAIALKLSRVLHEKWKDLLWQIMQEKKSDWNSSSFIFIHSDIYNTLLH